jgi:hypothetical protein
MSRQGAKSAKMKLIGSDFLTHKYFSAFCAISAVKRITHAKATRAPRGKRNKKFWLCKKRLEALYPENPLRSSRLCVTKGFMRGD